MVRFAELAAEARQAITDGDVETLSRLIDENFDLPDRRGSDHADRACPSGRGFSEVRGVGRGDYWDVWG